MAGPRYITGMLLIAAMSRAGVVSAQSYPLKPIRIVTSPAGGGTDLLARLVAQGISGPLGQQVVVDNRPAGLVGELGAKAPPDGYTLLAAASSVMLGPLLQKLSYDPVRDFSPVTLATVSPNLLVVHPSVPAKSVKELVALAKARPGVLNYATGGSGSSAHLAAELFKNLTATNIVSIPYKGTAPATTDLIAGQIHVAFLSPGSVVPHIKSGRLKALAVTTAEPSILFPGLPAIAATVPGYEMSAKAGIVAPASTPAAIINRLNQEIVRVLKQTDVKEKLFDLGVEAVSTTPQEFAAMIKSEVTRMGKLISDSGIRAD